jgi:hypothetical protein
MMLSWSTIGMAALLMFPSSSVVIAFNSSPVTLAEELGCSPTLSTLLNRRDEQPSTVFFDPLGLATDENFSRYREAELKHGRVAMISVIATLVSWDDRGLVLQGKLPPILERLQQHQPADWGKWIFVCGILETLILVQIDPQDMPGDYGLGYFGVRNKGQNERSLESELENGRLAMIVMLGYFLHDVKFNFESYQLALDNLVKT